MTKEEITGLTVRAVEQIGNNAAKQLEDAAEQLEAEAKVKGDHLRAFANAIREQTMRASDDLSDFVRRMNDVFKTNENLSHRIDPRALDELGKNQRSVPSPIDGRR
jgi:predicted  nucleic acid-binding Zn-ribbon protein